MKRPDKWDRKAENLWERLENDIRTDAPKIAAALRRTNAAAEKRGYAKAVADRKARVSEAFAKEEERRRGMEP